jgi:hypothetical protein
LIAPTNQTTKEQPQMTDDEECRLMDEAMELTCRPIMDRIAKALDHLGWKIVSQDQPETERPWTLNKDCDDCPSWAENPTPPKPSAAVLVFQRPDA